MTDYKILKFPLSKDKSVFYYYTPYTPSSQTSDPNNPQLNALPEERTLQVCHFVRAIEEEFIHKYFGMVGKIKQIHLGQFKNKANKSRKRRTMYFALVVYKKKEDM